MQGPLLINEVIEQYLRGNKLYGHEFYFKEIVFRLEGKRKGLLSLWVNDRSLCGDFIFR